MALRSEKMEQKRRTGVEAKGFLEGWVEEGLVDDGPLVSRRLPKLFVHSHHLLNQIHNNPIT